MRPEALAEFRQAIATAEPPVLGPQRRAGTLPVPEVERRVAGVFAAMQVPATLQSPLRSAALFWHDHLDASHTISQAIETRDGSWLHGMMHRREPDYGNAKYWFRRVGQHEAFAAVAERVAHFLHHNGKGLTENLIENGEWRPLAFIDECERVEGAGDGEEHRVLREIQAIEFDVLVAHILQA